MSSAVEALAAAAESVRALFAEVMAVQADRGVAMRDLAPVVAAANRLERTASAVTVAATAGYARRDPHDDLDDITVPVESIRERGFVAEWAATELGHLLRLSTHTAGGRVASAAQLTSRFPRVLQAVADGTVEAWQADKALGLLMEAGADDDVARAVDAWLAPRLATCDPSRILTLTRYALGRIAPHLLPERAKQNRARRALEKWEVEPGLCEITARMPTHQAAAIWSAATTLAKEYQAADPGLSLDQARLDAFVDLALAEVTVTTHLTLGIPVVTSAYARTGEAPTDLLDEPAPVDAGSDASYHCDLEADPGTDPPEPDPQTDPTEPDPGTGAPRAHPREESTSHPNRTDDDGEADTADCENGPLAGDGQPASRGPGPDYRGPGWAPAHLPTWAAHPHGSPPLGTDIAERRWWLSGVHLAGFGYVPPDVVEALTGRLGTVIGTALLDAEHGTMLSHRTNAYAPTKAVRDLVAARDGQCRFFGCTRASSGCDVDHAVPHHRGGPTSGENLAPLCRRHHRAKQRREWIYRLDPDTGVAWWTNRRTGSMRTTLPVVPAGALDPPLVPAGAPPPAEHVDDRLPTQDDALAGAAAATVDPGDAPPF